MEFVAKNLSTRNLNSDGIFHQEKLQILPNIEGRNNINTTQALLKTEKSHGFQGVLWGQHYLYIKAGKDILRKGHYRPILPRKLPASVSSLFSGLPLGTKWDRVSRGPWNGAALWQPPRRAVWWRRHEWELTGLRPGLQCWATRQASVFSHVMVLKPPQHQVGCLARINAVVIICELLYSQGIESALNPFHRSWNTYYLK